MTPLQSKFYGHIGFTLLQIQLTEHTIQRCLSYFLPQGQTIEEIEAAAEEDRNKTLGQLIVEMRKRIAIAPDFDNKLKDLIENRNALAHRLLRKEGVSISTDEGLTKGIEFLKALNATAVDVRKIIEGLMNAIGDAPKGTDDEKKYADLAKVIFG